MAKIGRIERNKKVKKMITKDTSKRSLLKGVLKSKTASQDEKFAAMIAFQKISRDGSSTRYRNRCAITGRPRGYYSKFGLSRNMIREYASFCLISGLKKSSW